MAEIIYSDLWLCQDCTLLTANGETGQGEEFDNEHAQRMVEYLPTESLGGLVLADDDEEFSTRTCDGCGTHLAGYRHEAAILS